MKRILLLEDDRSLGSTLKERLEREAIEVCWVETISKAENQSRDSQFDLFILDVGLPDGSGFDFAKQIRHSSRAPIIFVTAQSGAEDRLKGYEIGAEEYIPKPFHLKEFLLRVRHVMENHARPRAHICRGVKVDLHGLTVERDGQRENLTRREAEVLDVLLTRAPKVVSRDELLDLAWGQQEYPSNRTVDNIIVRLRQLLGPNAGMCIRSVRGVGYQWSEEEEVK